MTDSQPARGWQRRFSSAASVLCGCLLLGVLAVAAKSNGGVLVELQPSSVASFDAAHQTTAVRLSPTRNVYLVTSNTGESGAALLADIQSDPRARHATLNAVISLAPPSRLSQSTASVLNQSTASVLNSVSMQLSQSTASVLNPDQDFYGASVPEGYVNQPAVSQVASGPSVLQRASGRGATVAVIDDGVAPFNPVLSKVLLYNQGWNFVDNSPNWSAWDLSQSTASVLNRLGPWGLNQSTASVLNQSTASVLNLLRSLLSQSTASVLNGCVSSTGSSQSSQSTASVLNQSTASVLNFDSSASMLNQGDQALTNVLLKLLQSILQCHPDFGHGTAVAGLVHLIAPHAQILPITAFDANGIATSAQVYEALAYAIDHKVNVINLSSTTPVDDPILQGLVDEAMNDGITVVAAAGNFSTTAAEYPAAYPGVIGVGAVDGCEANPATGLCTNPSLSQLLAASFSNYDGGGITDATVGAPGVALYTTFPGFGLIWATSVSGTSFSTPIVAGEAALLAGLHQNLAAVTAAIESSADAAVPVSPELGFFDYGLVQISGALLHVPDSGSGSNAGGQQYQHHDYHNH
ncbi:MAG: S8 family peptidase [Terriglobales bacterium]